MLHELWAGREQPGKQAGMVPSPKGSAAERGDLPQGRKLFSPAPHKAGSEGWKDSRGTGAGRAGEALSGHSPVRGVQREVRAWGLGRMVRGWRFPVL